MFTLKTIASAGGVSVVDKANTTLKAFTLAEVLIVIGILGLIADMTIPTLISKTQEQIRIAQLKKVYSTIESAYRLAVAENGTPDNWVTETEQNAKNIQAMKLMTPYLKTIKNCTLTDTDCEPNHKIVYLNGIESTITFKDSPNGSVLLADGVSYSLWVNSNDCKTVLGTSNALKNICSNLSITFPSKNNNNKTKAGVDLFWFYLTKYGIVPYGTIAQTGAWSFEEGCNRSKSTPQNGAGCTAWVLYNNNMDYLHCNDLSWNGKKRCTN